MTTPDTSTSVVIIGAGQAGLSVAYYLARRGLRARSDFVVLDRGPGTGGAWQHRWEALKLGSAHRVNDLPGMAETGLSFETADRRRPARDVVAEYYRAYEQHFDLRVVRPVEVRSVRNDPPSGARDEGGSLVVSLSHDGSHKHAREVTRNETREEPDHSPAAEPVLESLTTRLLVNATGTWDSPFVPWYPGRDTFRGRQVHTADYVSAAEFTGLRVVVVGGGTSAIGFLLELEHIAGQITWVTRRPVHFLDQTELNLEAGIAAVAMQDVAARAGRALPSIVSGTGVPRTRRMQSAIDRGVLVDLPMFERIEPDGVRWSDGTFRPADVIIWATGFRPEVRHLAPLGLREKAGGISVVSGRSERDPRIFFAGYGPQASTIGANRAGRTIAKQVVAALAAPGD